MRRRRRGVIELEQQLIGVAPPPVFAGLERPDDGVGTMRVPMGRGVAVGRAVAAADVATLHAQPQVQPATTGAQAVLAPVAGWRHVFDCVEVCAGVSHFLFFFRRVIGPGLGGARADDAALLPSVAVRAGPVCRARFRGTPCPSEPAQPPPHRWSARTRAMWHQVERPSSRRRTAR
jgi:hypothetical protein